MVFLMIYAGAVWFVVYHFRRRWLGLLAVAAAPAPALCVTHALIALVGREGHLNWLPVVVWPMTMVMTAVGLVLVLASREPRAFGCHGCGYDLAGNESGICPECGLRIDASTPVPAPVVLAPAAPARSPARWAEGYRSIPARTTRPLAGERRDSSPERERRA